MVGISAVMLIPIGADRAQIGGTIAAGYIGGGTNFVAVARAVGLDDPTRLATVLGPKPLWARSIWPSWRWPRRWGVSGTGSTPIARGETDLQRPPPSPPGPRPVVSTIHLAIGLGLSLAIRAVGTAIARGVGVPAYSVLFIMALAVLVANSAAGPGQLPWRGAHRPVGPDRVVGYPATSLPAARVPGPEAPIVTSRSLRCCWRKG